MLTIDQLLLSTGLVAFGLNLVITPWVLRIAHRRKWHAPTNSRTIHQGEIPRLGGVAMGLSFVGAFGLSLVVQSPTVSWHSLVLLWAGLTATHTVGLLDDFFEFRAVYKGILQLVGALMALGAGLTVTEFRVPFTAVHVPLGVFGPFLTLIWILGVTNAVNLIDGIDGLAGGFSLVAFGTLGLWQLTQGHFTSAVICATTVGVILGFLRFNWPPARIFMGDSGSLVLGYLLAVLSLWETPSLVQQDWLLPVCLVLLPVADTVSAMWRRLRANRPIWAPDREHTHHKLMALGLSPRRTLVLLLCLAAVTAMPFAAAGAPGGFWALDTSCVTAIAVTATVFGVLHVQYRKHHPSVAAPLVTPLRKSS